ncbi:hypothetical protein [Leisingera sp. JC11]|uniref:hypothetical protein n=1 Tax=Leisingera sp. JC11 TaxID=3042469 RepID=UPI003455A7E9
MKRYRIAETDDRGEVGWVWGFTPAERCARPYLVGREKHLSTDKLEILEAKRQSAAAWICSVERETSRAR